MQFLLLAILLGLKNSLCFASGLGGPFLLWGHKKVESVQPYTLVEGEEQDFENLYKDAKAIVVFVRNSTRTRLDSAKYPKLQEIIHAQAWTYLPQKSLVAEPFNYNSNIEVINLGNSEFSNEDDEIVSGFNDAITIYGENSVLAILANGEDETSAHSLSKRQAKTKLDESTTTQQTPTTEETDDSFTYVAEGQGAVLTVNNAPVLNVSIDSKWKSYKLVKHQAPSPKFDDQSTKGYGRFSIIFLVDEIRFTLRFNFTLSQGYWTLKAVEVSNNENFQETFNLTRHSYDLPAAPIGFSYRCGPEPLIFRNGENNTLEINDYQLQPWLNGKSTFGDVFDCVGFITAPILAGVLVTLFLCGILSIGLMAIYDIKTPNRFESSRNKQLTFTVQE